ncbi:tRNA pseudouridine synthase-like 1 isoform X2 [Ceratina calcarata]|uniref:tRNA pseudouridine synthase n=1 Tax=Ceratina calcarata TaxID=156304 RepID=A0AAJ7W8L8_9HYME|nr:tRNA pseudouridine synthase-like 1 isoform X2 [Ceratina calcarata]
MFRGLQKNAIPTQNVLMLDTDTIQGAIEAAFSTLIPKCIKWPKFSSSSRTDCGVHGLSNAAHIDIENIDDCFYEPTYALSSVNRFFNQSNHNIRILEFVPVTNDFNSRRLAKSRKYIYRILRAKDLNDHRIPVSEVQYCNHIRPTVFDTERIKRATQMFMGTKDFRTFSSKSISIKPIKYVRELDTLTLEEGHPFMPYDPLCKNFEYWNIVCSAQGFLYKQVRRIVSSLIALGSGVITERDIYIMLHVPGHHNWLPYLRLAPAQGLFLADVKYCQEEIEEYIIKYKLYGEHTVIPLDTNLV